MNRYPVWKYVVIAVAIAIGFFYTLPNFFPEVPAVQVSTSKATVKIDDQTLAGAVNALKAANVPFRGASVDATGVKVRFADTDTQLKARDVLQKQFGDDYIVALNLISSSPQWLSALGALPMYLGLDLRGGVHFLLQIDMKGAIDKAADRYTTDIRSLMREKRIQYGGVGREGQNVVLRFREDAERNKARVEIEKAFPDLAVREVGLAGSGELRLVAGLKPEAQKRIQDGAVTQNITILRNRVNELGVSEPIVQQQGADRIVVQLPGVQDTARAKDILGRTATLEIRMVNDDPGALEAAVAGQVPFGSDLFHGARRLAGAGPPPGGADRRPHQRRAAGLRPAHERAGRAREPRRHRRAHLQGDHARERRQAHGDRAGREGQGRGHHRAGDPRGDRRRARADLRADEHPRGQRRRAADARRRAGGADGDRRGAHGRPVAGQGEHRARLQLGALRLRRAGHLHVRLLHAHGARLDDRAGRQRPAAGRAAVDAAGHADAAGHRGHRAHARHGDRRQRADQRAHPRGAALGRDAPRRAAGRLRARVGHDLRLERHDADRRHRAADLRQRAGARLRRRALPRHPDVDVLGGVRLARHRQPDLRQPQEARQDLDRAGLAAEAAGTPAAK